ncbi:MAG: ATP-binding cassette domain-containing protein [Yoonia sp.]|nr:ATP-binding cassette domain-containing protein [Yoonia sp.]
MLTCEKLELTQGAFHLSADVHFSKRAITAVIGPSGAGKSTLLLAIAGFVTAQSGQVLLDGVSFTSLAPGKRPVSMLFQDNNLFPHLSIFENVGLGLGTHRKLDAAARCSVLSVLDRVGLLNMADRKPAALSGGQQSRVALARLLLADRPVVLLDEPFAALGPRLKDEMLDLMQEMVVQDAGATVLMVTHDPADARRVADHVAWVADGVVHAPRPTAEIFADPPKGLRGYLGKMG